MKRIFSLMLSLNFLLPMGAYANTSDLSNEKIQVIAQEMDRLENGNVDQLEMAMVLDRFRSHDVNSEDIINFAVLDKSDEEARRVRDEIMSSVSKIDEQMNSSNMNNALSQVSRNTPTGSNFISGQAVCGTAVIASVFASFIWLFSSPGYQGKTHRGARTRLNNAESTILQNNDEIVDLESERNNLLSNGVEESNPLIVVLDLSIEDYSLQNEELTLNMPILEQDMLDEEVYNDGLWDDWYTRGKQGLLLGAAGLACSAIVGGTAEDRI